MYKVTAYFKDKRISQIFDGCASCRCICCGIFCCHKCKYKIIALSEALEVLTLPAARWEKECQTYFLKEALLEGLIQKLIQELIQELL